MEKLTLNDGTVLEDASAVRSGDLFLYMRGQTMKPVFDLLIEPEKTEQITYTMVNGEDVVFDGYSRLIAVRDNDYGLITAVMRKEAE